jgi:hypothetical protein
MDMEGRAALAIKIAETNEWLARVQYWNETTFKNRAYLDFMYEGSITEELKRLADFTGKKIRIIVDDK